MLSFKEYLQLDERVVSVGFNAEQEINREKYRKEILSILHNSYKGVNPEDTEEGYGGHKSGSADETKAINDDISASLIKATLRNGKITSVNLYKDKFGRKSIAAGTDGSPQGKKDFLQGKKEDNSQKRAWGEVSGKVGHLVKKLGMPTIPNTLAKKLTGKDDIELDADGERYSRKIGPKRHTKFIVGHPKID